MGNLLATCCGNNPESKKRGLLTTTNDNDEDNIDNIKRQDQNDQRGINNNNTANNKNTTATTSLNTEKSLPATNDPHHGITTNDTTPDDDEQQRRQQRAALAAYRYEQARCEMIVSDAGRDMITVGRRDGYYDRAYAAGVAQNLRASGILAGVVTTSPKKDQRQQRMNDGAEDSDGVDVSDVIAVLSRMERRWNVMEDDKGDDDDDDDVPTVKNINVLLEECAQCLLTEVSPTMEVFRGVGPIIENLS